MNTEDPTARTEAARSKFDERFYNQVDPDRTLPEAERERRAGHARKAYFADLAFKSAKARRLRSEAAELDAEVAAGEDAANP